MNAFRIAFWTAALLALVTGFDACAADPFCFKNHYILGDPCAAQPGVAAPTVSVAALADEGCYANSPLREISDPLVTADGKRLTGVLIARCAGVSPYAYALAVQRLNADGSADHSLNRSGIAVVPIWGYYEFADAIAVQPDGKILVGGNAAVPRPVTEVDSCYPAFCRYFPSVVRLNDDGTLDRTFNGTGKIVLAIGDENTGPYEDVGEFGTLTGMVLQDDGKVLIMAGEAPVARLLADGTLDSTFSGPAPPAREYAVPGEIVAEYYAASLDHYFMTWVPEEIAALEAGAIPGWVHTGGSFKVFSTPEAETSPVCRFYIPPQWGDSHFFGRDIAECEQTRSAYPAYILEAAQFMHVYLPTAGACPVQTTPVYRVFDARADVNHRYVTDKALRDQMLALGWVAEGDGPDAVTMCAPQ